VVANSQANLLVLGETLKGWNADVDTALVRPERLSRRRGLACAEGRPFRLVIVDRVPGGSDGFVLAEQIRSESQPTPPVILMTTLTEPGRRHPLPGFAGVSCIVKPVSPGIYAPPFGELCRGAPSAAWAAAALRTNSSGERAAPVIESTAVEGQRGESETRDALARTSRPQRGSGRGMGYEANGRALSARIISICVPDGRGRCPVWMDSKATRAAAKLEAANRAITLAWGPRRRMRWMGDRELLPGGGPMDERLHCRSPFGA
jgi:CheY-like chemotaxis protein